MQVLAGSLDSFCNAFINQAQQVSSVLQHRRLVRGKDEEETGKNENASLSKKQRSELLRLFRRLDNNRTGRVTSSEVRRFARELNIPTGCFTEDDFSQVEGGLDYHQFEAMVVRKRKILEQAFDSVDVDRDGYVRAAELRSLLRLMQLRDRTRHGRVTWRIGDSGVSKIAAAFEAEGAGAPEGEKRRVSKQELMRVFLVAVDERDLRIVSPYFMRVAVQMDGTLPEAAERGEGSPWQHLLSGGLASAVSKTAVSPLSVIGHQAAYLRIESPTRPVSIFAVARDILSRGGVGAFWRGNATTCLEAFPRKGVSFLAYEGFKSAFTKADFLPESAQQFAAGAAAGMASTAATYPLNTIAARLSVSQSPRAVFHGLATREGLRSLYQGLLPTLLGSAPFMGINFCVYEDAKRRWRRRAGLPPGGEPQLGHVPTLLCAAAAMCASSLATWPVYNVSRRMQLQSLLRERGEDSALYSGMADCAAKVLRREGVRGLYVGAAPGLLKSLPSASVQMVAYEQLKALFTGLEHERQEGRREEAAVEALLRRLTPGGERGGG